jgi:hypothetical protein
MPDRPPTVNMKAIFSFIRALVMSFWMAMTDRAIKAKSKDELVVSSARRKAFPLRQCPGCVPSTSHHFEMGVQRNMKPKKKVMHQHT